VPLPRVIVLCVAVTLGGVACRVRAPQAAAPPPAPALPPVSGLRVVLTWNAPVDLDLYVTDPTAETAYFGNNPSSHGARLVRDTRCPDVVAAADGFLEVAHVPNPMRGRYRIGVDFIDACNAKPEPVPFRVVAELGRLRREATGTIRLEEFQPIVLEFDLQQVNGDGPLVLSQEEG
jgi:hypothetical protein